MKQNQHFLQTGKENRLFYLGSHFFGYKPKMLKVFFVSMKGLVVQICQCEIFVINSLSFSVGFTRVLAPVYRVHACALQHPRARFPLHSGMQPVSALLNPHSASKTPKPLIFFFLAVSLPGREPLLSLPVSLSVSLSLSAGMNAHVEMLARLHTRTKFSHTKARESGGEEGREGGRWWGSRAGESRMKEPAAARSKAAAAPPR